MLFTEPRFFAFFLLVFALHWALRSNTARKVLLLAASYWFYGAWDERFLLLIVLSTLVDYVAALGMVRPGAKRGFWLGLSLVANLGMLGFFKYWGFFVDSAVALLDRAGIEAHVPTLEVVLPVGISFFTFQTMSYSLDVWRRKLEPTRSLLDVATFVGFFPQLVAGPIVRAADFLPQLRTTRTLSTVDVKGALMLFFVGFFKKACIADNLALYVDDYYARPEAFDVLSAWTAVLGYAIQLYCDFSGYSDMAIACAALLGYRLVVNFAFPYLSSDPSDFWRRWHVSLSTWLRDYVYVPLGGNRGGEARVMRNLVITMGLGGLWHGAAWNFVIWGLLHGVGLVVHRVWRRQEERSGLRGLLRPFAPLLCFWYVAGLLVIFRAESLATAGQVLRAYLFFDAEGALRGGLFCLAVLPVLAVIHVLNARGVGHGWWRRMGLLPFAAVYAALWAVSLPLVPVGFTPFLYFQF